MVMIMILLLVVVGLLLILLLLRFEITNPNFNDSTIESKEWINNFIPHFMDIISYLCRDSSYSVLLKGVPAPCLFCGMQITDVNCKKMECEGTHNVTFGWHSSYHKTFR